MTEEEIGAELINASLHIHRDLGPGLLESVYEIILAKKIRKFGLSVERQVPVSVQYEGTRFNEGFRVDLIVGRKVIVEIKSVENINNVHKKQLLTYLRLTNLKLGFLLNFGEAIMKTGITRIINSLEEKPNQLKKPLNNHAESAESFPDTHPRR